MSSQLQQVTVIYYSDVSLELMHEQQMFEKNAQGRVIIPNDFKLGKSIIAVCAGSVNILNKLGDRIVLVEDVA